MDISPVKIDTPASGPIRVGWIGPDALSNLDRILASAREPFAFACEFLSLVVQEPKITATQVRDWGVDAVKTITREWARHPFALGKELDVADPLSALRVSVEAYHVKWLEKQELLRLEFQRYPGFRAIQETLRLQQQIQSSFGSSAMRQLIDQQGEMTKLLRLNTPLAHIHEQIQQQASAIALATQSFKNAAQGALQAFEEQRRYIVDIFRNFPDPHELLRRSQAISGGIEALAEAGYGFTSHLWDIPLVVELGQIQSGIRGAVATNRFSAFCRDKRFRAELRDTVEATPVLRKRWSLLAAALGAHGRREYALAIPLLLSQLEGSITDMLVLRGEAVVYRGRLHARNANGTTKKGRDGKPVRLIGLESKLKHSRWNGNEVLESVSELMVNALVGERNAIMHGRNTNYATAKLCTQCILLVWVLAKEVKSAVR